MAKFGKSFMVEPLIADHESTYRHHWLGKPGYVSGRDGLWSVAYMVGKEPWAVGVAFHRVQDAELCLDWLIKNSYTPRKYHTERDEVCEKIKREIIANLAW